MTDSRDPHYEPTPEEIEEAKKEIQKEWTPKMRDARRAGGWGAPKSEPSGPLTYRFSGLGHVVYQIEAYSEPPALPPASPKIQEQNKTG